MSDFKKYNNCLISKLAPHLIPDVSNIDMEIKKEKCLMARYITDYDCGYETQWYYVIKDDKFDISKLKAKERNIINNGKKNFAIKIINPMDYKDSIYNIYIEMNKILSTNSRSNISKEHFFDNFGKEIFIGAFDCVNGVETSNLSAYAIISLYDSSKDVVNFSVLRYLPESRKKNVNAAIIEFICTHYMNSGKYLYINDGERSIRHDTTFQDYLIRYFGFRKAYCKLNVVYSKRLKVVVKLLYPFRLLIKKISQYNRNIYNLYVLLYQEEIARSFKS